MMRILIIILCAVVLTFPKTLAQIKTEDQPKEPTTKLEAFLTEKGKLIIKEFYELEKFVGKHGSIIKFSALIIYEPGEEPIKTRGLQIKITETGRYEHSKVAFLDLEEVESLSKAIAYMLDLSLKWKDTNKEYTELIFSTKGDFQIGFYQEGTKTAGFSSCGYINKARYFFPIKNLNSIKITIDKGIKLLSEKSD